LTPLVAAQTNPDKETNTVKQKLFILDAHPIVVEGLNKMLEGQEDIQVTGITGDVDKAAEQMKQDPPNVLLMDLAQDDRGVVDLIKKIKQEAPSVAILVFSVHDENVYAERCLRAGAMGYLMKTEPVARVLMAIRQVAAGGFVFSANLLSSIVTGNGLRGAAGARGEPGRLLSDRQLEIFEMVGRGMDSHSIAAKLNLSSKTVDAHKANIRQKLGLDSARELLMEAVRWVEK
jgi:DNA-binding NarL/FixJ family response regulator